MLCLLLCASFLQVEDNVTVILLSEIVWDTFRPNTGCFEPLLLHFPDYSKGIHRLTLLNLNLQSCFHKSGISFSWIFNSDAALYKFSSWWEAFIVKISCCFACSVSLWIWGQWCWNFIGVFAVELQQILSQDRHPSFSAELYSFYVSVLLGVFYSVCRDLRELRHLVRNPNFTPS